LRSDGRDRRGRSLFTLNVPEAIAIVAGIAFFLIVIASRAASLSVVTATFLWFVSSFACLSVSAVLRPRL
jgi:hypothetical protein